MPSSHKIAIIGGGSAYVPGILHSLIRAEEALRGTEIALMDIAAPWRHLLRAALDPSDAEPLRRDGEALSGRVAHQPRQSDELRRRCDTAKKRRQVHRRPRRRWKPPSDRVLGDPRRPAKEAVRVVAPGVNHHTWVKEATVDGRDAYPLIRKYFAKNRKADFATWAMDRLGVFPAISGYLYQYFDYPQALADARREDSVLNWFMEELSQQRAGFKAMANGTIPVRLDATKHHTSTAHGDIAVDLTVCICMNRAKEFHVNTPNTGAITNLPADAIVEVPALVDAGGVRPLYAGEMPRSVLGLTQALLNWQELTVDAALSGKRNLVARALMAHPWLNSGKVAEELCDEMVAAHAAFLPQFRVRKKAAG